MKEINFGNLIHSATYYLCYQNKIGRDFMIDESVLKFPIADYLTGLEIPLKCIKLEFTHPYLKKRSIDLVTTMSSDPDSKLSTAFEFKLAKYGTHLGPEKKRVFHDIARLHMLAKTEGVKAYFLIIGRQSDFIQYFMSVPSEEPINGLIDPRRIKDRKIPEAKGYFTEWFSFSNDSKDNKKEFKVQNELRTEYNEVYQSFTDNYKPNNPNITLTLPEKITTECIGITNLSFLFPTPYIGGIWRIS